MRCDKCGLRWNDGDPCPKCEHTEGDFNCTCKACFTYEEEEEEEDDEEDDYK